MNQIQEIMEFVEYQELETAFHHLQEGEVEAKV